MQLHRSVFCACPVASCLLSTFFRHRAQFGLSRPQFLCDKRTSQVLWPPAFPSPNSPNYPFPCLLGRPPQAAELEELRGTAALDKMQGEVQQPADAPTRVRRPTGVQAARGSGVQKRRVAMCGSPLVHPHG